MGEVILGKFRQSLFPDFPRGVNMVRPDGHLSNIWELALSNVFQNLQRIFSNEGYALPILSEEDINFIESIYTNLIGRTLGSTNPPTPDISGRIVYDVDNEVPKIFIIKFATPGNPNTEIQTGTGWKTFTIT